MKKVTVLMLAILALLAMRAGADELDDLKAKVDAQDKEISQLKGQMDQLDSQQRLKEKSMNERIDEVDKRAGSSGLPESMKWAEKISWYGDFRYRHEEYKDETSNTDQHFNRNRLRARVGMRAEVTDELLFNMRFGSGSNDPTTSNQTLGESWSSKPVWIDRAYIAYKSKVLHGFGIGLGKDETPYYKQNMQQLVFDDDLNPEGIYAEYNGNITNSMKFTMAGGGFWVVERHGANSDDTQMFGGQVVLEQAVAKRSSITGAASWYKFTNLQGQSSLYSQWAGLTAAELATQDKFFGNDNTGKGGVYRMNYQIVESSLGWQSVIAGMPYSVYAAGVINVDAITNSVTGDKEDTGYNVGFSLNEAKKKWDWQLSYDYRHVKADAAVAQFNDSDFLNGNTGGKGHVVAGFLQLAKNTQLGVSCYINNKYDASHGPTKAGKKHERLRIDLKVKFK